MEDNEKRCCCKGCKCHNCQHNNYIFKKIANFAVNFGKSIFVVAPSITFFVLAVVTINYILNNFNLSCLDIDLGTGVLLSVFAACILIITIVIQIIFVKILKRYKPDVNCENIKFLEEAIKCQKKKGDK